MVGYCFWLLWLVVAFCWLLFVFDGVCGCCRWLLVLAVVSGFCFWLLFFVVAGVSGCCLRLLLVSVLIVVPGCCCVGCFCWLLVFSVVDVLVVFS